MRTRNLALTLLLALAVPATSLAQEAAPDSAALPKLSELQNTTEISEFEQPIKIIAATEYWDGGTTFVVLQDAKKRYLLLCVSQWASESTVPANTLFLNAPHPDAPNIRLPFSEGEVRLIVGSLNAAVEAELTDEETESLAELGDPAEYKMYQSAAGPANEQQWNESEWNAFYAFDALRRLKSRSKFDVVSADGATTPSWHAAWVAEIAAKRAEEERKRKADELFESFYPEAARACFHSPTVDSSMVASSPRYGGGKREADPEDPEQIQGRRIAELVGDPNRLAVSSCKALGTLTDDWTWSDSKTRIAIAAAHAVNGDAFLAALDEIQNDPSATLGAARLFFYERLADKLPEAARLTWGLKLGEAVLNSDLDEEKHQVLMSLGSSQSLDGAALLARVAEGVTGKAISNDDSRYEDPSIRATAYLLLAARGDASIRSAVEASLQTAANSDKAAYELSLAFLGDASRVKAEHFELDSYIICGAALKIIEKNVTSAGLELLFSVAFESNVADEAVLAAQRITGQTWVKDERRHESFYAEDARQWWAGNKAAFLAKGAAEKP
jgi:hypothetical protein